MKILLTTLNAKYVHSSLALRYLEKYCADDEYEIIVEEYTINDHLDDLTASIYKTGADIFAFSCYIWNIAMSLEIADRLKKIKPGCIIIFGGPEVSYDSAGILEQYPYIDYIVMGEGEETLKELLHYLKYKDIDARSIKGLVYRNKNNHVVENEARQLICDLNTIPLPYNNVDLRQLSGKLIYYETSRGCPFFCIYCLSSTIHGVRYFSMERVKKDLLSFIENDVKLVKFVDRTFNAHKQRTMELFEFLVQNRKNTSFHFEIAADLLDDEMMEFLVSVPQGLFQFEIGVQSTNMDTIRAIQRTMDFDKVAKNVRKLREAGNIHLHLDLIAGLPGEDYQSFAKSFDDVYRLDPHALQLGFLKLLKGSKVRKQEQQYQYQYTSLPPYEVLCNHVMSYDDILKLKQIEDVLEKYHSSGAFQKALAYILCHFYQSPFQLYEDLARYFEKKGLDKVSHSKKALYDILYEFYRDVLGRDKEVFAEFLKFDLVYHQKGVKLPYWANAIDTPFFKEKSFDFLKNEKNIEKFLPQLVGIPAKKVYKQVHFEVFSVNVLSSELQKTSGDVVVLFDYDTGKVYDVTKRM